MKIQIEHPYVEAMVREFPDLAGLQDQLRFGNRVEVHYTQLSQPQLVYLGNLYQAGGPELRGQLAQLATLRQAINDDGTRFTQGELEQAAERFAAAATIEEALAERAEASQEPDKAMRLRFSAASGWAYAGDFHHALTLLRSLDEHPDVSAAMKGRIQSFAATIRQQREHWHNALRETNLV